MNIVSTQGQTAQLLVLPQAQASSPISELALDIKEVAGRFQKCTRTISIWCEKERFPHYKVGNNLMFSWPAIEAWVQGKIQGNL